MGITIRALTSMETQLAPFINIVAVASADNKLRIEQVLPVSSVSRQHVTEASSAGTSAFAEMLSKDGRLLLRQVVESQRFCSLPVPMSRVPHPSDDCVFAAILQMPPDASLLRVTGAVIDGQIASIAERKVPSNGPTLQFTWDPANSPTKGVQTITWQATHPDSASLLHTLCLVPEKGPWLPLNFPCVDMFAQVDFDSLPGGSVSLGVQSTDGFHITRVQSSIFQLPLRPTVLTIISPAEGQHFDAGQPVILEGHGYYRESGEWESRWLFWSSDLQGELGPSSRAEVILKSGNHQITLRGGTPGREGKTQVNIVVDGGDDH